MMRENILLTKTLNFAAKIVKLRRYIASERQEPDIARQLLRSSTSIGANANEAVYGTSRADFIAKLHISLKETGETEYWLRLLKCAEVLDGGIVDPLIDDCLEIKKILVATLNTAKNGEGRE